MKVLLSAFSFSPGRGSEPGVGWNWLQQIRRAHEVWLLTSDEYKPDIEREIPKGVHVTYVLSAKMWYRFFNLGIGLDWLYYYWWQWKVYRVARKLHGEVGFDLAHHVTFVSWRAPSFLCLLPIPMIWGPVAGGGGPPWRLRKDWNWKDWITEILRDIFQQVSRLDPFVRLTMRRAAAILVADRETAELVPRRYRSKVRRFFGIGMSSAEIAEIMHAPARQKKGFLVVFVAILRGRKGGGLAIRAFAQLARSHPDATLLVIGKGVERNRMVDLARELGISDHVQFLGWLSRTEALSWMRTADVLLFPSLRDSGGISVLEAMADGKPVVCMDLAGPGHIVTTECGFKVNPAQPYSHVVSDLAGALGKLAADPGLCRTLGEAGQRRVQEQFDWDHRGERMLELYEQIVGQESRGTEGPLP